MTVIPSYIFVCSFKPHTVIRYYFAAEIHGIDLEQSFIAIILFSYMNDVYVCMYVCMWLCRSTCITSYDDDDMDNDMHGTVNRYNHIL